MSEVIKVGDKVDYECKDPEDGKFTRYKGVIVLNMPRGEGDTIQLELSDGSVMAVSACSSDFICLRRSPSNPAS